MATPEIAEQNRVAWEAQAYESWLRAYGTPDKVAFELTADPTYKLRRFLPYLGNVEGKKIANPLGSHGRLGVALGLLGADVTIFDTSASNQKYALELAHEAGVSLNYIVGDFLSVDLVPHVATFDFVVLELGIIHYFVELDAFVDRLCSLLVRGGSLVLHEFHPLIKKSISSLNQQPVVTGDYFFSGTEKVPVAYASFADEPEALPKCLVRRWTLGEIVTAFAQGGFVVEKLLEAPDGAFPLLPGTFTLVVRRL